MKKYKIKLFNKRIIMFIVGIGLVFIIIFSVNWVNDIVVSQRIENVTIKQYDAPKSIIEFQPKKPEKLTVNLVFDDQNQKEKEIQQSINFTKIKNESDKKKKRSYDILTFITILISVVFVFSIGIFYHNISGNKVAYKIEMIKK
ncbi:MAG: hypothetical protein ACRCV7_02615 [Culicoidibacterales bacterium]